MIIQITSLGPLANELARAVLAGRGTKLSCFVIKRVRCTAMILSMEHLENSLRRLVRISSFGTRLAYRDPITGETHEKSGKCQRRLAAVWLREQREDRSSIWGSQSAKTPGSRFDTPASRDRRHLQQRPVHSSCSYYICF
ncbi:hypothetical protein J6590_069897 [Homalodisca vitripennis]|nr:hypothetical protein J6590_069897 [Homalodisca vitripennis]